MNYTVTTKTKRRTYTFKTKHRWIAMLIIKLFGGGKLESNNAYNHYPGIKL